MSASGDASSVEKDVEEEPLILSPSAKDDSHDHWIPSAPVDYRRLMYNIFAGLESGLLDVLEALTLSTLIFSHQLLRPDIPAAVSTSHAAYDLTRCQTDQFGALFVVGDRNCDQCDERFSFQRWWSPMR